MADNYYDEPIDRQYAGLMRSPNLGRAPLPPTRFYIVDGYSAAGAIVFQYVVRATSEEEACMIGERYNAARAEPRAVETYRATIATDGLFTAEENLTEDLDPCDSCADCERSYGPGRCPDSCEL